MAALRILLADDHTLVRETLGRWLASSDSITVIAQVSNSDDAITIAAREEPDIVVLDINMPGADVFEAARIIRIRSPKSKIIFLSAFHLDRYIEQALAAGALGYVTKGESPETLERAIRAVASGGVYFSPDVQARIVIDVSGPRLVDTAQTRTSMLTPRELEVLRYLATGLSKKEIADKLDLSIGTINNHAANLMRKLDIHDRVKLTHFAIREGLIGT
ncbi:MAG: response regulator transcription factor [Phycisphaerales bacterium]|nr:response regulator transcription factor [Phycisphaerales bacterium]